MHPMADFQTGLMHPLCVCVCVPNVVVLKEMRRFVYVTVISSKTKQPFAL